jgi:hypothetical protein
MDSINKFLKYHESKTNRIEYKDENGKDTTTEYYYYDLNTSEYMPIFAEVIESLIHKIDVLEKKIIVLENHTDLPPPPPLQSVSLEVRPKTPPQTTVTSTIGKKKPLIQAGFL